MTAESPAPEPVSPVPPRLRGRVLMNQDWRDLTFLHWAVPPERVSAYFPPGTRPDTLGRSTYVGLVPFRLVDAGLARGRAVPWLGTFLETNVRLYSVDATGRRGVVFASLDANRLLVVAGARLAFHLPYRWARMSHRCYPTRAGAVHDYRARLRWPGGQGRSHVRVRVGGPRRHTPLDDFVSARWGLHTRIAGRTTYVPNHHAPWPLHDVEMLDLDDELLASVGLGELAARPPDHVAFSPGVHAVFGIPVDARRPRPEDR